MNIPNYSKIKLLNDNYLEEGVKKGDFGYIIEVYEDGYEVEFSDKDGNTIALFSVKPKEIESVKE
jgi:Domain of unknown function (DUF4926)